MRIESTTSLAFWIVVLASITACGATPLTEDQLPGVWEAEVRHAEGVAGEIRVEDPDGNGLVTFAGTPLVRREGSGALHFTLPDESGAFRGKFDPSTQQLAGHWVEAPTDAVSYSRAYPLEFHRNGDVWTANVQTSEDALRFYLRIDRQEDGSLRGFVRNPERNLGLRLGYLDVTFVGGKASLFSERLDSNYELKWQSDPPRFEVDLPYGNGQPFRFSRAERREGSAFFAHPTLEPYTYRPPIQRGDGWPVAAAPSVGLDVAQLEDLVQSVCDTPTTTLTTPYIHSILVARGGRLVLEEYFHGYGPDHLHDTRSAGKSVGSMLVGAALDATAGLDIETRIAEVFGDAMAEPRSFAYFGDTIPDPRPDLPTPSFEQRAAWREQMTIGHALSMQSGLDIDDNDYGSPGNEDLMQNQSGQPDWRAYALGLPMIRPPGTLAIYGSNNIALAASTVGHATGTWLPQLLREALTDPLGIQDYVLNLDPVGQGYFGGGIRLTARDQLKLGQVMLSGGTWNGTRVLSEEWVRESWTPHGSIHEPDDYGYGWWRGRLPYRDGTIEVFYASGNGGQLVICAPELDMVVQFSGGNYSNFPVWYRFLTELTPRILGSAAATP